MHLSLRLLAGSAIAIQAEHLMTRQMMGMPRHLALRLIAIVFALVVAVSPGALVTVSVAFATALCFVLAAIYLRAPDGLDTADSELWVFLVLTTIGLASSQARGAAGWGLITSFCAVYLFAGLNKARSSEWRNGTAFSRVLEGNSSPTATWVRTWPPLFARTSSLSVIALQILAAAAVMAGDVRALWYIAILCFQATIALLMGIPSFLLVAVAIGPVMLEGWI